MALDSSGLTDLFAGMTSSAADPAAPATDGAATGTTTGAGGDLVGSVEANLTESLAINSALQQLYLAYSTFTEALRIISEAVQKGIDISENERQDISQGQE